MFLFTFSARFSSQIYGCRLLRIVSSVGFVGIQMTRKKRQIDVEISIFHTLSSKMMNIRRIKGSKFYDDASRGTTCVSTAFSALDEKRQMWNLSKQKL